MDDTVAVALFRHGLTEANKSHAYLGWTDSPLCPEHKNKLAPAPQGYRRIFASDLGRCMKTAAILFPDHSIEPCPEWREMHFGEWEGRTYQELKDNPAYQKWLEDPFSGVLPGGESFAAFTARVDKGWQNLTDQLLQGNNSDAAVITHGGVIRYLLGKYAPEEKEFWEWQVPFGRGYELRWTREAFRRGVRCTSLQEAGLTVNLNG
ncbi:histidine phosphatase family protein [Cytobacillus firmus]|uniref:histidine phosphatase family protein n=1 Tax=Cytobacillus firmus TaxID=1399 RepID=UPI002493E4C1|nr:histidine phosphatase family protein [Cytobacillus firmus]